MEALALFGFGKKIRNNGPQHRVCDILGSDTKVDVKDPKFRAVGLTSGTRVATSNGWCPVDKVRAGDSVLTFDAGQKTVRSVSNCLFWSRDIPCPRRFWPLLVPQGAIDNIRETLLLPDQPVMIETGGSEFLHGGCPVLVHARTLVGLRGIRRVIPSQSIEIFSIHLDSDQVVLAENRHGYLCRAKEQPRTAETAYRVLLREQAFAFVESISSEGKNGKNNTGVRLPTDDIYAAFSA